MVALGLPLRSVELELGPSQCEFTFAPQVGLAPADTMVLFRSAVKQIARRNGLHATFMCRPRLPNAFSSGWHLHQSLIDRTSEANAFASDDDLLSPLGRCFLAGLSRNARAAAAFTTPTLNGYKRYRPYPARARPRDLGARQSRRHGAGDRRARRSGDAPGEPRRRAGRQSVSLHGVADRRRARRDRRASSIPARPPTRPTKPTPSRCRSSLAEALDALRTSACFRAAFGDAFVDYFIRIKEAEIARFQAEVTEWEHKEYFDLF